MTAEKVDLKRSLDCYRARYGRFRVLTVSPMQYLALDGHGDSNTSALYEDTLASLDSLSYAVKTSSRRELGRVEQVVDGRRGSTARWRASLP